ncbi:hypothetical protein THERMOS_2166 [Bathymodiolus thermophilus thioautotrophic gill symbiont]|uniref:Uncharacterized protein n=1 Tax=Bathymodiolus thermophilus thioautotrophic gill symbiont TaxID=2360 RepID=A0A8H8XH02_9GAMM|nr:hypothetical protein THERMOS_2166 [Bathymodiolus thermophilus thioautotrophic gill symbiont]
MQNPAIQNNRLIFLIPNPLNQTKNRSKKNKSNTHQHLKPNLRLNYCKVNKLQGGF